MNYEDFLKLLDENDQIDEGYDQDIFATIEEKIKEEKEIKTKTKVKEKERLD